MPPKKTESQTTGAKKPARVTASRNRPDKDVIARRVPQQARALQKYEQILQAAAIEVREGGLERLTTNRIAQKAGLSVGTVYGYFPNKESIIVALHTRWLDAMEALVLKFHPANGGPGDLISYMRVLGEEIGQRYQEDHWAAAFLKVADGIPELKETIARHDANVLVSVLSAVRHFAPAAPENDIYAYATTLSTIWHAVQIEMIHVKGAERDMALSYLETASLALAVRVLSAPPQASGKATDGRHSGRRRSK